METKTTKGKLCLIFENNKFRRYHEGKIKVSWRCTNQKCKAKVHTLKEDNENNVLQANVEHNHEDSVPDLQKHMLREACKENTFISSKPETVVCQQLSKLIDTSSIGVDQTK